MGPVDRQLLDEELVAFGPSEDLASGLLRNLLSHGQLAQQCRAFRVAERTQAYGRGTLDPGCESAAGFQQLGPGRADQQVGAVAASGEPLDHLQHLLAGPVQVLAAPESLSPDRLPGKIDGFAEVGARSVGRKVGPQGVHQLFSVKAVPRRQGEQLDERAGLPPAPSPLRHRLPVDLDPEPSQQPQTQTGSHNPSCGVLTKLCTHCTGSIVPTRLRERSGNGRLVSSMATAHQECTKRRKR